MTDFTAAVADHRARREREQRQREGREAPGERYGRNRVSGERVPAGPPFVYRRERSRP